MNKIKTSLLLNGRLLEKAKEIARKEKVSFGSWIHCLMRRALENSKNGNDESHPKEKQ